MGRPVLWIEDGSAEELLYTKTNSFRLVKRDGAWVLLGDTQGVMYQWSNRVKNPPKAAANKLLKALPLGGITTVVVATPETVTSTTSTPVGSFTTATATPETAGVISEADIHVG